jgi:YHS domain-containing protein
VTVAFQKRLSPDFQNNMTNPNLDNENQVVKTTCGGTLQDPTQYPSAMFKGEMVYFCNTACLNAFLKAPQAFMAGEIEHPLDNAEENAQPF